MEQLAEGVRRVTFRLPFGIDHVHCYLLRSSTGGWTLVDTGLGTEQPERVWGPVVAELDAPIERIVVTHMHPDHVGGARDAASVTGAPVLQGREDHEQCVRAWGQDRSSTVFTTWWASHGMPRADVEGIARESRLLTSAVHWVEHPQLLEAGDEVDGWRIEVLRGHADGHIVLLRDGVMIAGDTILNRITPAIGLYPNSRRDPLGDYLETLARIEALAPRVAYAGHHDPILDPAARAQAIATHHADRLDHAEAALGDRPRNAYEVSLELFTSDLSRTLRRFALAESLAHLERLVHKGRATREGRAYRKAGM